MSFDREDILFNVVINHEEQYSVWPDYKPLPLGWHKTGFCGTKKECITHIDEVWTDLRPLSLRKKMSAKNADLH